jgi:hypothetical protein
MAKSCRNNNSRGMKNMRSKRRIYKQKISQTHKFKRIGGGPILSNVNWTQSGTGVNTNYFLVYHKKSHTPVKREFNITLNQIPLPQGQVLNADNYKSLWFELRLNEVDRSESKHFKIDLKVEYIEESFDPDNQDMDTTKLYNIFYVKHTEIEDSLDELVDDFVNVSLDHGHDKQILLCSYKLTNGIQLPELIEAQQTDMTDTVFTQLCEIISSGNLSGIKDANDESNRKIYNFSNVPRNLRFFNSLSYKMIRALNNQLKSYDDAVDADRQRDIVKYSPITPRRTRSTSSSRTPRRARSSSSSRTPRRGRSSSSSRTPRRPRSTSSSRTPLRL